MKTLKITFFYSILLLLLCKVVFAGQFFVGSSANPSKNSYKVKQIQVNNQKQA